MTDVFTPDQRAALMSRIRGRDTKPEMVVRRLVHALGFRYRLHRRDLPGSPDLVFRGRHKVIFVHGCFWHRHPGCKLAAVPKTGEDFWQRKFEQNVQRDRTVVELLKKNGWEVLIVWECETRKPEGLPEKVMEFLSGDQRVDG